VFCVLCFAFCVLRFAFCVLCFVFCVLYLCFVLVFVFVFVDGRQCEDMAAFTTIKREVDRTRRTQNRKEKQQQLQKGRDATDAADPIVTAPRIDPIASPRSFVNHVEVTFPAIG
jgi:hypothetical protein